MEKKKVILTLCKSFPVTHSKAGEATDFEKKLKDKSKIHTIRYNAKNDGLSVEDFVEWFFGNNKENVFEGVVIHFTDFRY